MPADTARIIFLSPAASADLFAQGMGSYAVGKDGMMLQHVTAVLDLADEQMAEIEAMYQQALEAQEVPDRLQALIKGVIDHNRSALDYVANAVAGKHGKPAGKVYWPYAITRSVFDKYFDKNLPGVRQACPDVVQTWKKFQPFEPGYEWIGHLVELAKENKHRELTAQTRTERVRMEDRTSGGLVSWYPSAVTFGPGVSVHGQPVNVATQRTANTIRVVYVDWRFANPNVSALGTLREIQQGMRPMLQELCDLADL